MWNKIRQLNLISKLFIVGALATLFLFIVNGQVDRQSDTTFGAPSQSASFQKHIFPFADGTYDLGSSTRKWNHIYTDGCTGCGGGGSTLHVDGGGFVYPQTGDYHSAPYYVATTTGSTFGDFISTASSTVAGHLTAEHFYGDVTGQSSTTLALIANGANCSAGNYPLGVDASGAVESCTADSDTQLSEEQVEDFVGGMLGGTETLITVTYQDATNDIDFVVTDTLSSYTNDAGFITSTLTQEEVEDYAGAMWTGNTETGITITYQDVDGTIDAVLDVTGDWTGTFDGQEGSYYLDFTNLTVTADEVAESAINFSTSCDTGNHLYISGGNLACEADSDTQLTEEQVEDFVGGMLGGTEDGIDVTYQDGTNNIDFTFDCSDVSGPRLGCSGEDLIADVELYTDTFTVHVASSTLSTTTAAAQHKLPSASTITRVSCSTGVGTGAGTTTIDIDERVETTPNTAGTDVITSPIDCGGGHTNSTTSFSNAGIAADNIINFDVDKTDDQASGATPTVIRIHVEYTIDD